MSGRKATLKRKHTLKRKNTLKKVRSRTLKKKGGGPRAAGNDGPDHEALKKLAQAQRTRKHNVIGGLTVVALGLAAFTGLKLAGVKL